ncbi:MAG: YbaN family protein [Bacteroidales bacterium]|nr:YbaN family protein [Bacteroidales bacterium]
MNKESDRKLIKYLLTFLGLVSLGLAVIGIFVPLLPTTPFLLLSATLFLKSSPRLYKWLLNHKYLGTYISNYLNYKVISLQTKIASLSLLWIVILGSVIFYTQNIFVKILLLVIAVGVSIHILSFKSKKEK